ncbi:MAG: DUF4907 domain-containing protein [Puia sp.]|nr:DUF4907 domain-containing protein [Puia sp.]
MKKFKWIAGGFGIMLLVGVGLRMRHNQQVQFEKTHVYVQARPISTSLGWGYEIVVGDTIFIHQEFIPAIPGKHGFRTKEDAMKVGMKIIDKMKHGKVEAITVGDLREMGIIDSIPANSIPTVIRPHRDTVERMRLPK